MHPPKPFYTKPQWLISAAVVLILAGVMRLLLPMQLLNLANHQLNQLSPHIQFEAKQIELQILRGEYTLKDIEARINTSDKVYMFIKSLNAQTNWKNIWRGKILTRIYIDQASLTLNSEIIHLLTSEGRSFHETLNKLPQFKKVMITDSQINFENFPQSITDVTIEIDKLKYFNLTASIFGSSPMRAYGTIDLKKMPLSWDINAEMKDFDLTTIADYVHQKWGLQISQGRMDLYSEAEFMKGKLHGYMKPFLSDLKLINSGKNWKSTATMIQFENEKPFSFIPMAHLLPGLEHTIGNDKYKPQAQEFR